MNNRIFKYFWYLYLFEFITPFVLILNYLTGIDLFDLIKIIPVLYYVTCLIGVSNKRVPKTHLLSLFILYNIWGFTLGIANNPLDNKFLSHIYFGTIPILGIIFGYNFAEVFNDELLETFLSIMKLAFWGTFITLCFYFYYYYIIGSIAYWGFGTDLHLIVLFLLFNKKYFKYFISLILTVLSGKRATLLNFGLISLLYFIPNFFGKNNKKSLFSLLSILLIIIAIYYLLQLGMFKRMEYVLEFNRNDEYSTIIATGGRWQEIIGIIEYFIEKPLAILVGAGYGGTYLWFFSSTTFHEYKHYAHFTPVAYAFIYGVPFAMILYTFLIRQIIIGFSKISRNPFFFATIVSIFGSFFGANMLVDIKIWIFIGMTVYSNQNPKAYISQLKF